MQDGATGISLVIFDCDGVLIDSEIISAAVLIEEAAEHGVALTPDYVRDHFVGRSFPTVAGIIRDRFRIALPIDFESRYRARLLERFETELTVTPGLMPLLRRLNVRTCVATSSSPPRLARSLAITGLDGVFARTFTASEVARGKPAPDLFLHAAAQMGVAPAACLVIEDSRPGIIAAQAAGMRVALYTGAGHMRGRDIDSRAFDSVAPLTTFEDWAAFPVLWPDLVSDARNVSETFQ